MKKVLSLFLSVVMLLSITAGLNLSAYAAEVTGKCGENVKYSFDPATGILKISGTGDMYAYEYADFDDDSVSSPFSDSSKIKNVIIENGVTSIGDDAFVNCYNLASVTISNSVTDIGDGAFRGCSSLKNITIPDGVTSIGNEIFSDCSSLASVTIPNSVINIGNATFSECSSLKNITIPDSVISIGFSAFSYCSSLSSITIPDSVTDIDTEAFSGCSSLKNITIPDSLTYITFGLFRDCSGLESITIPDSVTDIGYLAFSGCTNLKSITIPDSVISIGNYAFENVTPNNVVVENGMRILDGCLLDVDSEIKGDIIIPENIRLIADGVFYECDDVTSVTIPDGVISIGNGAFSYCSGLESVTIPESVTSIGNSAFYNCASLKNITIPDGVTVIDDYTFSDCSSLTNITIPDNVVVIGDCAFENCTGLTSINIPDSVMSIGFGVFYDVALDNIVVENGMRILDGCLLDTDSEIKGDIIIPENVRLIADDAFAWSSDITSVKLPDGLTCIGIDLFRDCTGLTSMTIPDSVISIGANAFNGCTNLKSITIPDSVISIGDYAFENVTPDNMTVENGMRILDGCLVDTDYAIKGDIIIPENVRLIADNAFTFRDIASVTIPDSVMSIGFGAFDSCRKLTDVYFSGTEDQWNEIIIDDSGIKVNVHFKDIIEIVFADLTGYNYYSDFVKYTSIDNSFIKGTNPPEFTEFSPKASITRAMFVTILYRMAGEPYANGKNPYKTSPFTDITNTSVYYYDSACWALKNGITTETTFKPFDNVTREQTAAFLFRYAKENGKIIDEEYKKVELSSYPDYNDVHKWAVEALQWANYNKMITGTQQGYINPEGATQRIHATKILYGFGKACNIGNF